MFDAKQHQPPPVDTGEMSFAIALFVAAARGRIILPKMTGLSSEEATPLSGDPLLAGANAALQGGMVRLPDEVPLICAVSVLWHHYEQDVRQQAICSRLVAFHSLMARGRRPFMKPGEQQPAILVEAALSPAIANAVATATVSEDGLFEDAEFESLVEGSSIGQEGRASWAARRQTPHQFTDRLSVTEDVQQLSLQLFAFQSCVAADPTRATPHFRTLEQLCARVADISGTATLHAMLSRAWRAALPDFAWLGSTAPLNARLLTGLQSVQPAPGLREAMKCEMAILGLLIELLRTLLGDAVTVQLLRSLWPLADLGGDPSLLPRPVRNHDGIRPAGRSQ